jgi:ubiquitin carboxyl-terminal hydrolase 2
LNISLKNINQLYIMSSTNSENENYDSETEDDQQTRHQVREFFTNNGLKGLANLGDTCFMNTAVHCFSNTLALTWYIISGDYLEKVNDEKIQKFLIKDWENLLNGIWEEDKKRYSIAPNSFLKIVKILSIKLDMGEFHDIGSRNYIRDKPQKDVQEFINFFINILHDAISEKIPMEVTGTPQTDLDKMAVQALTCWKNFFEGDYSILVDIFYGQTQSRLIADDGEISDTYEPFNNLVLPIPQEKMYSLENPPPADYDPNASINIYDCFNLFTTNENMEEEWYSSRDKKKKMIKKRFSLWKTPSHLIIVLNRFVKGRHAHKRDDFVDFPLKSLDISKYCIGYDRKNSKYDLYAVANHTGGMGGGHYYAYCKNLNGNWYEYNDRNVDQVHNLDEIVSNDAYVLFYQKKTTDSR